MKAVKYPDRFPSNAKEWQEFAAFGYAVVPALVLSGIWLVGLFIHGESWYQSGPDGPGVLAGFFYYVVLWIPGGVAIAYFTYTSLYYFLERKIKEAEVVTAPAVGAAVVIICTLIFILALSGVAT